MKPSLNLALMASLFCFPALAQLSPGKLAKAHAHLEGLSNCSTCHQLGSHSFRENCLSCHKALNQRITAGKGLHAGKDYETCQACHSDHQGEAFELIHWPEGQDRFDHAATGYALEGKHKGEKCLECHQAKNLAAKEVLAEGEPKSRFLGLKRDCSGCHEDIHKGQLGENCLDCHGMDGWKPALRFDHGKTVFPLVEAHAKQECKACHPSQTAAEQKPGSMRFKPIAHDRCVDCHVAVHKESTDQRCESCHNQSSFAPANLFDHQKSGFPLTGLHKKAECFLCHPRFKGKEDLVFTRTSNARECLSCHKDPHETRLGANCESCHSTEGWREIRNKKFDHQRTRFALKGKHQTVGCEKCHGDGLKGLAFETCSSCHEDRHKGQFRDTASKGACEVCHNESGFVPALYTIKSHNLTNFPLKGAHLATPCFACHLPLGKGESANYSFEALSCLSCHKDLHQGEADPFMTGKGSCGACHTDVSWQQLSFNHDQTVFPLEGVHQKAACGACHQSKPAGTKPRLSGIGKACSDCHQDVHQGQFRKQGLTQCESCHQPTTWAADKFDHNRQAAFSLEGAHSKVACSACHTSTLKDGKAVVIYKPLDPSCNSCHNSTNQRPLKGRTP